MDCDVAIVGGGPAGSTAGAILKKYNPNLSVVIFEKEKFPRDHVGESQLPPISRILHEMGCWDKIEEANFPIKIGATYRWGKSPELWDFDFLLAEKYEETARPGLYEGQRRLTAFQVERSTYDDILLKHASSLGCDVHEDTKVMRVSVEAASILGLTLSNGETVTARHYIDASGEAGVLRRALGINCEYPSSLRNIAIWDYWRNAEWMVKIGVGGTRIQIWSLGYGWIWFIPLGTTRTSIGLVVPAHYYKQAGERPESLYLKAMGEEPLLGPLIKNAVREGRLQSTKDWSFLAERLAGPNWFLVGDSGGFADPILSAGMTLGQEGAREVAYTILEAQSGQADEAWMRNQYQSFQRQRIMSHIRFADYWYTANAQFSELKEYTAEIAMDAGLDLSPERAWQWLGQGGFILEDQRVGVGGFNLTEIKTMGNFITPLSPGSPIKNFNVFPLDLEGAKKRTRAQYVEGHVRKAETLYRSGRNLPMQGPYAFLVKSLGKDPRISSLVKDIRDAAEPLRTKPDDRVRFIHNVIQCFEAMIEDGWVKPSLDPSMPVEDISFSTNTIHRNHDANQARVRPDRD